MNKSNSCIDAKDFLRYGGAAFLAPKLSEWRANERNLRTMGQRLAHVRSFAGVSQAEMAAKANVSLRTWQNYEQDKHPPDANALTTLWRLGLDPTWVLTGAGSPASTDEPEESSIVLSGEILMISHELAEKALQGAWLPKPRFFDLVILVYIRLLKHFPYAEIIDFARSEASKLAGERTADTGQQENGATNSDRND